MKISAHFAMWGASIFAIFCLGYSFSGFSSLDAVADEAARADARGFAMFWLFLGVIGITMAIVSWWMTKHADD